MRPDLIAIVLFAVIAAFVLFQLYNVLGRRVGRQPGDETAAPQPAGPASLLGLRAREPAPAEPAGVAAIRARDPEFDPSKFLDKASQAYSVIVKAFASGDRAALAPMLSPTVAKSFNEAIDQREAEGRSQTVEFLHPPRADLDRLDVVGEIARARVRFLAELRTRSKGPEGEAVDDRRTAELWTFERALTPGAPGWALAGVEAAEA
jgi:predicted lipid-binding transport protein (Tim44 family)